MIKNIFLIVTLLYLSNCGQLDNVKKIASAPSGSSSPISSVVAGPYTPGAYFKILKEVGSNNDTRVYEFQYWADGTFILWQKNFAGGNLVNGSFHKTSGTYIEDKLGHISHTVTYDTCNDLSANTASITGNPHDIINVFAKGTNLSLYSYMSWSLPADISAAIGNISEDVGCKKF